jgi:alpha-tubulin suppressor-like RCC1 family protein
VGIPSTFGSSVPTQVGTGTNWVKVWAGLLETVAMQSNGTLWYWGESPDPAVAQGVGSIVAPALVNDDTNWVDVGFGENTVLAIKSNGTLWAWGRQAHLYTGNGNQSLNTTPMRVGTNSDWQSISGSTGWWCSGLRKKDGSLWLLDLSEGMPNGPRSPKPQPEFRRVSFKVEYIAFAGGAVHAAAAGYHGHIGVAVTRDGEVWTWGMVLGDPPTLKSGLQGVLVKLASFAHVRLPAPVPPPVFQEQPWQIRND